ncbi:surface-adhesin E family protein [Caballeronia sp. INML1]|uniref:surface-adhesin E family protein n=1 Tax=Caballeronia sp. INML1 TaxID=2921760 RepID=UPI002028F2AD|nr:surface-adhesin E family protein [Caballeronia sp. INML1]
MLKNLVAFTALACATGSAFAENWVTVDPTPNRTISVDLDTIASDGVYRKVWVRSDWPNGVPNVRGGERVGRTVIRYTLRCSDHEFSSGQMAVYDHSFRLIDTVEGAPNKFEEPVPGSFAEKMINAHCASK